MATYFADSSGLVKRHVLEIGSGWFSQIADAQAGKMIIRKIIRRSYFK